MSRSQKIISPESEVSAFLKNLKEVMTHPDFDVLTCLDILPKKKHEPPDDPFTTTNTMVKLDFDRRDVLNKLLNLDISDYMETFIDDKDSSLPPFFAFGKKINCRDVYIKVKIRNINTHKIYCVSFHFARFELPQRPYA